MARAKETKKKKKKEKKKKEKKKKNKKKKKKKRKRRRSRRRKEDEEEGEEEQEEEGERGKGCKSGWNAPLGVPCVAPATRWCVYMHFLVRSGAYRTIKSSIIELRFPSKPAKL